MLADLANILDARVRRGIDLVGVGFAGADCARENAGGRGFAGTARAGKQVRVYDLVALERAFDGGNDMILSDEVFKGFGSIFSIQCGVF